MYLLDPESSQQNKIEFILNYAVLRKVAVKNYFNLLILKKYSVYRMYYSKKGN